MDLPKPVRKSHYSQVQTDISTASKTVAEESLQKSQMLEKEEIKKQKEKGLTVSGDGSWRKKGFSSLFGFATLIAWFTGKVVDLEVKSKYCQSCTMWKKKEGTPEYEEWRETHAEHCLKNHDGSSGEIEVDAVVEVLSF